MSGSSPHPAAASSHGSAAAAAAAAALLREGSRRPSAWFGLLVLSGDRYFLCALLATFGDIKASLRSFCAAGGVLEL